MVDEPNATTRMEVLALLAGLVAGAALFQHFQPPHFSQAASALAQPVASAGPVRSYPADPEPLPSPFARPEIPLPSLHRHRRAGW